MNELHLPTPFGDALDVFADVERAALVRIGVESAP